MKKKISMFIVLSMLALPMLLIGCNDTSAPPTTGETHSADVSATTTLIKDTEADIDATSASESNEEVEIRASWWGDTNRHELYNKIIDEFQNENPEITVVREPLSQTDYWDKFTVQSASGSVPDFLCMHPSRASDYVGRGVMEPLDQYVEDGIIDLSHFSEGAKNTGISNGVQYMVPMGITFASNYVNLSLLEEIGLEPPKFDWTWDDLMEYGMQAREALDAAGKTDVWLMADSAIGGYLKYFIRQKGHEEYDTNGDVLFTVDEIEEYFNIWVELAEKNIIADAATAVEYRSATLEDSLFAQGRVIIRINPINQYKIYSNTFPDMKITNIRYPSSTNGVVGESPEGAHFAVSGSTTSEKKLAAAKLLNFWVNSEKSIDLFRLDQGVPANQKMAEFIIPELDEQQIHTLDYVTKLSEFATASIYPPTGAAEISALLISVNDNVAYGVSTPREAAEEYVNGAKEIRSRNQ